MSSARDGSLNVHLAARFLDRGRPLCGAQDGGTTMDAASVRRCNECATVLHPKAVASLARVLFGWLDFGLRSEDASMKRMAMDGYERIFEPGMYTWAEVEADEALLSAYVGKVADVESNPDAWLGSDDPRCVAFARGVLGMPEVQR